MKAFPALMSPIKIRNRILKSRFMYPCALPHFLQGPEPYPGEPIRHYYQQIARSGAAIIFWHDLANNFQRNEPNDAGHFACYDVTDKGVQNYMCQFAEQIHYYNTLLTTDIAVDFKMDYTVCGEQTRYGRNVYSEKKMFTKEDIEELIQLSIDKALIYKGFGWDAVSFDISRGTFGEFRQASVNHRTDEYGGSFENRIRMPLEFIRRLREAIGNDMLIIVNTCGCGGLDETGHPWEDDDEEYYEFLRRITPYVDLLHLRVNMMGTKDDYLNPIDLRVCDGIKAAGITIPVCARTGFQTPDLMENTIASGRCEMMSSAQMFIANSQTIGKILEEGRSDDVTPCLHCHVCNGVSMTGPWTSRCSVNPELGIGYRLDKLSVPTQGGKTVAVVGGGPVGMYAALKARERGHIVTIFEETDTLGGQLAQATKSCLDKANLARYLDFLRYQVGKQKIDVRFHTHFTPEMADSYDVVLIASGARPTLPNIPGAAESVNFNSINIYGNEDKVGKRVVVVGGSTGLAEAAAHLFALGGHEVTMITRAGKLGHDLSGPHTNGHILAAVMNDGTGVFKMTNIGDNYKDGFQLIKHAKTLRMEPGKVTYADADGAEHTIECDTIIANGGMRPDTDEMLSIATASNKYFIMGDANGGHNLYTGNRDAFAAINQF